MKYRRILKLNVKSAQLMKQSRAWSITEINSLKIHAYPRNWLPHETTFGFSFMKAKISMHKTKYSVTKPD